MKRNVDLTANGDFSDKSNTANGSFISVWNLFLTGGDRIPWKYSKVKEVHSQEDALHSDLVITGNKSDRVRYRAMQIAESTKHCDRCGKKLNIMNSDLNMSLCSKCYKSLEKDYGKVKIPFIDINLGHKIGNNYWTQYMNHRAR